LGDSSPQFLGFKMTKDTIQAAVIQGWLDKQARVPLRDDPLFKLVWSDDARELRTGTYRVYFGSVFIRETQETKLVPKYSWIKERWVLEQWFSPEVTQNDELPDSFCGSYEPIFVFDKNGEPLPLALLPVQYIVQMALKPQRSAAARESVSKAMQEAKEHLASQQDWDLLNDEGPLVSQLHDGTAILNAWEGKKQ